MDKNYRPLSENSEVYKIVASIYDTFCSPSHLMGDMVLSKVPYAFAFSSHNGKSLVLICQNKIRKDVGTEVKEASIKRYLRHHAAKRREEYETLLSMGFVGRLWYYLTTL